jgi:hypothetical protein
VRSLSNPGFAGFLFVNVNRGIVIPQEIPLWQLRKQLTRTLKKIHCLAVKTALVRTAFSVRRQNGGFYGGQA